MSSFSFQVSEHTKQAQASASDPGISAWVSANAGSGKTTVLVRRVLRLLLTGVDPAKIVCLTFTKAAAANMKIRLFGELRNWAALPEDDLISQLTKLSNLKPPPPILARARTLFATALETPGGLKIDTIHGFCTRLLQSAPFEANVPASFEIVQDADAVHLIQEAVRDVLTSAANQPEATLGQAMRRVAQDTEETRFADLVKQLISNRALLSDEDGLLLPLERVQTRIAQALNVSPADTTQALAEAFMAEYAQPERLTLLRDGLLSGKNKTEQAQAERVSALIKTTDAEAALSILSAMFLKSGGERLVRFVSKSFAESRPDIESECEHLFDSFTALNERLQSIAAYERSSALMQLAHAILTRIETFKARRRLLDFDDIIIRARSLLSRVEASWVLYKLDAGIDHVLIDEAQDTSGAQWDIIKAITSEFFAGKGARPEALRRTVFAVGDEKQSIYSFQKAEPAAFDEMRNHFTRAIAQAAETGHVFERIQLDQSFRSTREVMAGVDLIFKPFAHHKGLVFEENIGAPTHSTARQGGIGAVDLWPLEIDDASMERKAWDEPVDAASSSAAKLALRIATVLKRWTDAGRDDLGRPFKPGDVLILLRKRSALFQAIVRELKQAGVPVAGVDRLDVASHVAVEDMIAVASAALLPVDDLTLAVALKTPIYGLDDTHLIQFAPKRPGSLREAVRAAAGDNLAMLALNQRLTELEKRARRLGPFGFFAQLLGPDGGRKAMLSRLGAEAGDALDAFLSMALDFERKHGPSLGAFLNEVSGTAQEIKRDLADESGEVRVMTVHGAKGLEAPVVIIPDLGDAQKNAGRITLFECPLMEGNTKAIAPLWVPRKELHAPATKAAKAEADEAQDDERRRLFYVALTRAKDRIILCGANAKGEIKPASWYGMALHGLGPELKEVSAPIGDDVIQRFQLENSIAEMVSVDEKPALPPTPLTPPEWVNRPAPQQAETLTPLAPSQLQGSFSPETSANTKQDEPISSTLLAGQLAHRLLQYLPSVAASERLRVAASLAATHGATLDKKLREQIVLNAVALLARTDLQTLFGLESLAEVALRGDISLPDGRILPVAGRIDRLAVAGDTVWIADYKTGRVPASVEAIRPSTLSQIAAYHALIEALYPRSSVRSLVIYLGEEAAAFEPTPQQRLSALTSS